MRNSVKFGKKSKFKAFYLRNLMYYSNILKFYEHSK